MTIPKYLGHLLVHSFISSLQSPPPPPLPFFHQLYLPGGSAVKNPPAVQGDAENVGKITWRRAWQPTPVFLPGESRGQRSLVGYSLWVCKEVDMIEVTEHAQNAQNLF